MHFHLQILSNGSHSSRIQSCSHVVYKIFFNIEDFDTGVYNLKQSDGNIYENQFNHAVVVAYISSNYDKKYISKEGSGTVTFTDVSDTNVAGVFEFTLYNENDETDIIRVTKGKFND